MDSHGPLKQIPTTSSPMPRAWPVWEMARSDGLIGRWREGVNNEVIK